MLLFFGLLASAFGQTPTDTVDAHGFYMAPSDGDLLDGLSTWRAEKQKPQTVDTSVLFEYAAKPLTLHQMVDGVEHTTVLVDNLTVLNLGAFYAPTKQVAITLTAPVYLSAESFGIQTGAGLGDFRLAVPITLLPPRGDGLDSDSVKLGLSVVPFLDTPGFAQGNLSTTAFSGGALAAVSARQEGWDVSANVGVKFAPELNFYNLRGREQLLTNLSVGYEFTDSLAVRGELVARPSLRHNEISGTESPAEVLASLRGFTDDHLGWTVGAGKALNHGVSAATWRAFAGVEVSVGKRHTEVEEVVCPKCEEPASPEVKPEPDPEPESLVHIDGDHLVLMRPIYFDFDKADIRFPDSQQVLSDLVKVLTDHPEIALLQVATGTDPRGTAEYNQDLSLRRAQSVVTFLKQHGLDGSRFTTVGYGESRLPMGKCSTEECYQQDRFAEFSILRMTDQPVWK